MLGWQEIVICIYEKALRIMAIGEASMIFNVEDGHWYDVTGINGNKIIPLKILGELVDGKEPENELLKWEAFKKKYFIPERCVD